MAPRNAWEHVIFHQIQHMAEIVLETIMRSRPVVKALVQVINSNFDPTLQSHDANGKRFISLSNNPTCTVIMTMPII